MEKVMFKSVISIFLFSVFVAFSPSSNAQENPLSELLSLSLEDLETIEVTSVSKKEEKRFQAASAITVITNDDIRRSGVSSIPELLRFVPGVNVAQIDSNKWAISARGFNRQFSNKLLVLLDGRSVYTPLFSGVYWDAQDLVLADIDRIEVVRGPGAALWGANAVNGVVNIITKDAEFTQGAHLSVLSGNDEKINLASRYGGQASNDAFYRVYGKYLDKNESTNAASFDGNDDDWSRSQAGFRVDWKKSFLEHLTVQGDVQTGHEDQTILLPGLVAPAATTATNGDEIFNGANILANWVLDQEDGSQQKLQVYIDYVDRDVNNLLDQETITFDIDYQNSFHFNGRNEVVWGAGYRFFKDDLGEYIQQNGQRYLNYEPESSNNSLFSAFIQDQIALIPDKLYFTLGSKIEHNYFTDFEIQPSARLAWYPQEYQTFWLSASRAVRIPTRGERGLSSIALSAPGGFVRLSASADRNFDSEKLTAFELGHRIQPNGWVNLDTALFYNIYDELRTFEPGTSNFNNPNTLSELIAENLGYGETYGLEFSGQFSLQKNWIVTAAYSLLQQDMHIRSSSLDFTLEPEEHKSPEQQVIIASRLNLPNNIELDNNLFFVDELSAENIPAYVRFDSRVAWKPAENVELSLVGQNIFDKTHQEFTPFLFSQDAEIGRSFFVKLDINF